MKRISLLSAVLALTLATTGCVIDPKGVDPLTGCRTGCSVEAVPGGPLDCCFWLNALQCPILPWNWGQFLHCNHCDIPPCGKPGFGCGIHGGHGPVGFPVGGYPGPYMDGAWMGDSAYPPMMTGPGCCDTGVMPGMPMMPGGACADGSCGVPPMGMPGMMGVQGHVPHMAHEFAADGIPTQVAPLPANGHNHGQPTPVMPMTTPMTSPMPMPMPMPMAPMSAPAPNPDPSLNPQTSLPPASLMAPTSYQTGPFIQQMGYQMPALPRTASPYVTQPRAFPAPNALPITVAH